VWPQIRSGRSSEKKKNLFPAPEGNSTPVVQPVC